MVYGKSGKRKMYGGAKRYTRRSKASKKGLTKKERTQVKTIAKKTVNALAETKYFETNARIYREIPNPIWRYTNSAGTTFPSDICCLGYTTGKNRNYNSNGDQVIYRYGVNNVNGLPIEMTDLQMNKVFINTARPEQALDGNTCRPGFNEVQWVLDRPQANVTADPFKGLPYKVRIIRVVPRALKGSFQQIDPQTDLFLDQYNMPYGVATINPTTSEPVFQSFEFHMGKVNSRRYRCIQDTTISMLPSSISDINFGAELAQVSTSTNQGFAKLKTKHTIGKELFYKTPNEPMGTNWDEWYQYPDTGFQNEFIFFHFLAVGNPEVDASQRGLSDNVFLTARPVSTFKDI